MASFTAKDVAALRGITGAGMMDCKAALTAAEGDREKAVTLLREKGLAAAAKKAGRIAAEGIVYAEVAPDGAGAVIEVNSETDFVAKNEDFQNFVKGLAKVVLKDDPADVDALKALSYDGADTVEETLRNKVLVIGENLQIRRFRRYADGYNVAYNHMGGKVGVITHFEVSDGLRGNPELKELAYDVAMQVCAMKPQSLSRETLDPKVVEEERSVITAQLKQDEKNANKPEAVLAKIVEGRIGKFFSESCLLDQAFFKDEALTVGVLIAGKAKALGGEIKLLDYTRFEKGEGIAKREDNFADEVAGLVG